MHGVTTGNTRGHDVGNHEVRAVWALRRGSTAGTSQMRRHPRQTSDELGKHFSEEPQASSSGRDYFTRRIGHWQASATL
jgi:hypothetical protein